MACNATLAWLLSHVDEKALAGLFAMGRELDSGPFAPRNLLWSGFCGEPKLAPIETIPMVSGAVPPPSSITQVDAANQILLAGWQKGLQDYLDERRRIWEEAGGNGSHRGTLVPYREQHAWRSHVWDILLRMWNLLQQVAQDLGQFAFMDYAVQEENWRRRRMNNELSQENESLRWDRRLDARTMIGNVLGTAIVFTEPEPEE